MTKIYPSILSADFGQLAREAQAVEKAGADALHVDIMDGSFVPNITIGPDVVKALKKSVKIPLDCHLMIVNADAHLESFAKAGAERITVHQEACPHLQRTLAKIKELGCKAGVSINPATPFENLQWILPDVDLILCMTVNPGFGGQKLIPEALRKAGEIKSWLKKSAPHVQLQIDGGVSAENAPAARKLGVDILVAGSAVFGSKDYAASIRSLRGQKK
ncbi:MAG: ribulose-phosphate 3-epimerase [Bdellovibrionales bacterium]|nr:ribulose-phosphate 3-epimerase [Bdellovibrionales bacterium]